MPASTYSTIPNILNIKTLTTLTTFWVVLFVKWYFSQENVNIMWQYLPLNSADLCNFEGAFASSTTHVPPTKTTPKTPNLECYYCDNNRTDLYPPCTNGKNGTTRYCTLTPIDGPYCETVIESGTVTRRGCAYVHNPDHKLGCFKYYDGILRCLCNRCGHYHNFLLMKFSK